MPPVKTPLQPKRKDRPKAGGAAVFKALVEMGFIIFLFYSNLLMGEYTRSQGGAVKSLWVACADVVTWENLSIAGVSSLSGYWFFEHLRKKF